MRSKLHVVLVILAACSSSPTSSTPGPPAPPAGACAAGQVSSEGACREAGVVTCGAGFVSDRNAGCNAVLLLSSSLEPPNAINE